MNVSLSPLTEPPIAPRVSLHFDFDSEVEHSQLVLKDNSQKVQKPPAILGNAWHSKLANKSNVKPKNENTMRLLTVRYGVLK